MESIIYKSMKKILLCMLFLIICVCFTSCKKEEKDDYRLSIISPNGAPGVALADMAHTDAEEYSFEFNKTPQALQASFVAKDVDVIIAPINLGATLYTKSPNYVLASVITWGNLFFASQKENFTIDDLKGENVTFFGEGTINDVVVQYILKNKNITANPAYVADTSLTSQKLVSDANAVVLIAEPSLSAAKMQKQNIQSISVQDLYKEVSGSNSYPQAGCFINVDTIVDHKKVVREFLKDLEESCRETKEDTKEVSEYAVELGLFANAKVLEAAIPNSNIQYVKAMTAKSDIEKMVAIQPKLFGGANPVDEFYYA